ncbi:hypothetical protein A4G18_08950 [Pasteurellaceae bacterium Pebbles2]|nr:hypothetical protein [Pasteurellaceae bacterium Pebbles2]
MVYALTNFAFQQIREQQKILSLPLLAGGAGRSSEGGKSAVCFRNIFLNLIIQPPIALWALPPASWGKEMIFLCSNDLTSPSKPFCALSKQWE